MQLRVVGNGSASCLLDSGAITGFVSRRAVEVVKWTEGCVERVGEDHLEFVFVSGSVDGAPPGFEDSRVEEGWIAGFS